MKKFLLFVIVTSFSIVTYASSPFDFGVRGGVSNTKMKVRLKDINSSYDIGYYFGVYSRLNITNFYIEPSLLFRHNKSQIEKAQITSKIEYNAFDIPIVAGYHIVNFPLFKIRTYIGPVFSFSGKLNDNFLKSNNKNFILNGKVGVGVTVWRLAFDVDYQKGFANLNNNIKSPRYFNFTCGLKLF